jgi:hypothetical protein
VFSFISSASVRDRCSPYYKILFFQQRKLKWEKVKGGMLSSVKMSTAGNRSSGTGMGVVSRGNFFSIGILAWFSGVALSYNLIPVTCNTRK